MNLNQKQEKISRIILEYLRKNPSAGDTLEGISRWWLELERIELTVKEVADVLGNLVKNGAIRVQKIKGGTTFYKINKKT